MKIDYCRDYRERLAASALAVPYSGGFHFWHNSPSEISLHEDTRLLALPSGMTQRPTSRQQPSCTRYLTQDSLVSRCLRYFPFSVGNSNACVGEGIAAQPWNLSRQFLLVRCSVDTLDGLLANNRKSALGHTRPFDRNQDTYKLLSPGIRAVR